MSSPANLIIQPKKVRSSKKPPVKLFNPVLDADATDATETVEETVAKEKKEKAPKEEREQCSICANYYTAIIRKKTICKYCNQDTCSKCVEHYLLSRHDDAHCLHCHVNYSDEVLRSICTKTYLQQTYFHHRQAVLMNRGRSQLPALQDEALTMRKRRERASRIAEAREQINILKKEKNILISQKSILDSECYKLRIVSSHTEEEKEEVKHKKVEMRARSDEIQARIVEKSEEIRERKEFWINIIHARDEEQTQAKEEEDKESERRRFIRRCTREDCKGFLSQAWKCGMCEWYSCSKCFAVKGKEHDAEHECTKDALETADLIRKNCKPCPKCGEQIEHGGGCSQMWCISCQTPWDWNTGKIVTNGRIHNPLYYEWLKRNDGAVPREPNDIPCGGYPRHWELVRFPRGVRTSIADKFYEFFRICQELNDISDRNYRSHLNEHNVNDIHVRFLLHDFDEKTWGRHLATQEKRKKRDSEIQEVFAAFHMVAVELINRVQNYHDDRNRTFTMLTIPEAEQFIETLNVEIQELLHMINDAFRKISIVYCYNVPYVVTVRHSSDIIRYGILNKSFANEVKKRRNVQKTEGVTIGDSVTVESDSEEDPEHVVTTAATIREMPRPDFVQDESDDSEVEEIEVNNGYESDSSVTSDIQAAIAASLQH